MEITKTARNVDISIATQRLMLQISPIESQGDHASILSLDEALAYLDDEEIRQRHTNDFAFVDKEVLAKDYAVLVDLFDNQGIEFIEIPNYFKTYPHWSLFFTNSTTVIYDIGFFAININDIVCDFERLVQSKNRNQIASLEMFQVNVCSCNFYINASINEGLYKLSIFRNGSNKIGFGDKLVATVTAPSSMLTLKHQRVA